MIASIALFAGCSIAGNISGGFLNPAIGFAQCFVRLLTTGNVVECSNLWLYIIGPTLGSIIAAYAYKNFFKKYFQETTKQSLEI